MCSLALVSVFLGAVVIVWIITRHKRRKRNALMRESLGQPGLEFEVNERGLLDARGSVRGREVLVTHTSDVWGNPPTMLFRVEHRVPDVGGRLVYDGYNLDGRFIEKRTKEWPDDPAAFLEKVFKKAEYIEGDPGVLEDATEE